MAELATIARPYAHALFSMSEKQAWHSVLKDLANITQIKDFLVWLRHPATAKELVLDICSKALNLDGLSPNIAQAIKNFIHILLVNRRFHALPEIYKQFDELYKQSQQVVTVRVISANPLTDADMKQLSQTLESKLKQKMQLIFETDPQLIGGFKICVNDKVLDISYMHSLQKLEQLICIS